MLREIRHYLQNESTKCMSVEHPLMTDLTRDVCVSYDKQLILCMTMLHAFFPRPQQTFSIAAIH